MKQIKDYIRTNTVIHCESQEEYDKIQKLLIDLKYANILNFNYYKHYGKSLVIYLHRNSVSYSKFNWFESHKEYEDFELIKAKEFLEDTNKNSKVGFDFQNGSGCITLTNEINDIHEISDIVNFEYGYPVGSLCWAINVAEEEGMVYHKYSGLIQKAIITQAGNLCWNDDRIIHPNRILLTGWFRQPKSDKEKLLEKITEIYKITAYDIEEFGVVKELKELLDKYEVKKIE